MKKFILDYICYLEGSKTAIKSLHWYANSLSQHKLCDDIASSISDIQDTIAEIEQSISGNLPFNKLSGRKIQIKNLKTFLENLLSVSKTFYKKLDRKGVDYVGMKSECETFIGSLQKFIYLADFTLKEDFIREYKAKLNENRIIEEAIRHTLQPNIKDLIREAVDNVTKRLIQKK